MQATQSLMIDHSTREKLTWQLYPRIYATQSSHSYILNSGNSYISDSDDDLSHVMLFEWTWIYLLYSILYWKETRDTNWMTTIPSFRRKESCHEISLHEFAARIKMVCLYFVRSGLISQPTFGWRRRCHSYHTFFPLIYHIRIWFL